jgi:hypothetical protein
MKLTSCQNSALDFILKLLNDDKRIGVLSGNAGTGKTFLVSSVLMKIFIDIFDTVYILAPTDKATCIIADKVMHAVGDKFFQKTKKTKDSDEIPPKIIAQTLAKFLHEKPRYDDNNKSLGFIMDGYNVITINNERYYYNERKYKIKDIDEKKIVNNRWLYCPIEKSNENYLIIIDECSMISQDKINILEHFYGNQRILYLGDALQIPPVDGTVFGVDTLSPVFLKDYPQVDMVKIKRTKSNDLGAIYELTRDIVEGLYGVVDKYKIKKFTTIKKYIINEEELDNKIRQDIIDDTEFCILSFQNEENYKYTKKINEFLEQEKVTMYGYFIDVTYCMSKYYSRDIKNNKCFRITDVKKDQSIEYFNGKLVNGYIIVTDIHNNFTKTFAKIYVLEKKNHDIISAWYKLSENILKGPECKERTNLIAKLCEKVNNYSDPLEGAFHSLQSIKNLFMLQTKETFQVNSVMTIHKSQGSGIQKCYVNLKDIFYSYNTPLFKAKLLYVGSTRAVKEIYYLW